MANGPQPMRNMKPANKLPNSAEQFHQEHQAQYERHGQEASRVDRVRRHNNACPKLCDELRKRRSLAQCHPEGEELYKGGKNSHLTNDYKGHSAMKWKL